MKTNNNVDYHFGTNNKEENNMFNESVEYARNAGINEEDILKNKSDIDDYFMGGNRETVADAMEEDVVVENVEENKEEEVKMTDNQMRNKIDQQVVNAISRGGYEYAIEEMKGSMKVYQTKALTTNNEELMDISIVAYSYIQHYVLPKLESEIYTDLEEEKESKFKDAINNTKVKFNQVKNKAVNGIKEESFVSVTNKVLKGTDDVVGKAKTVTSNMSNRFGKWFVNSAKKEASNR